MSVPFSKARNVCNQMMARTSAAKGPDCRWGLESHFSQPFKEARTARVRTGTFQLRSFVALAVAEVDRRSEAMLAPETDRASRWWATVRNSAGRGCIFTSSQTPVERMATAVVPHHCDFSLDPRSVARILLTFAPYTDTGRPNRMVLPLRAVRQTN